MEEDIKILENYIYGKKETMKEQLVPAIKNLIKGYRELKIKSSALENQNKYWKSVANDSISKTKVEEMLKELNKKEKEELKGLKGQDRYFIKQMYMYKRNILQELLGDEE